MPIMQTAFGTPLVNKPHGIYRFAKSGSIIFIDLIGAWNGEAATLVIRHTIKVAKNQSMFRYGLLVDLTQFELGTPDFSNAIRNCREAQADSGLIAIAHICPNTCCVKEQLAQVPTSSCTFDRKVFYERHLALNWFERMGINTSIKHHKINFSYHDTSLIQASDSNS